MSLTNAVKRVPPCIETCDTTFPDCIAINTLTGDRIKIEFEYRSAAFLEHKKEWLFLREHEHTSVRWMIVCWEDDLGGKADGLNGLEIVPLNRLAEDPSLVLNPYPPDLRSESEAPSRFDWRAASLTQPQRGPHVVAALTRLRQFGETNESGFSIVWPTRKDKAKFSVVCKAHGEIGFGASAMGTIGIPFSKWNRVGVDVKYLVIKELNAALRHMDFNGHAGRKRGYDIEVLLPDENAVEKFLNAWRAVVAELDRRRE